jgi:dihydroorotase
MYYPVFEAMEDVGMVLNLHGEVPSNLNLNIHVLNAEASFLPHLVSIHSRFPKLRVVLEHATTRAAVDCVKSLGETVACTITAHHLALTVDDWAGQSWHYCKPVAKTPDDLAALQAIIREGLYSSRNFAKKHGSDTYLGHPRFFLGSDSAPHPPHTKATSTPQHACAAGIYTSPILLPLVAHLLESFGALNQLQNFTSTFGRKFYRRELNDIIPNVVLLRKSHVVAESMSLGEEKVIPFWAGRRINWSIDTM